ncbi:type II toxin-antitoxin system RelE/ParE family toxin [soil metagenome]
MKYQIVILQQAELDLLELKNYIVKNFSLSSWQNSYTQIKKTIHSLKSFPQAGKIPTELQELNLTQYRQVFSGLNRIIYELRQDLIYIHIICDTRKDMQNLLTRRLLQWL